MGVLKSLRKIIIKNQQKYTAFEMIKNNDIKALKKYIKKGKNLNKRRCVIRKNYFFSKGKLIKISLLYLAIYMKNTIIIELLLRNAIRINNRDEKALIRLII